MKRNRQSLTQTRPEWDGRDVTERACPTPGGRGPPPFHAPRFRPRGECAAPRLRVFSLQLREPAVRTTRRKPARAPSQPTIDSFEGKGERNALPIVTGSRDCERFRRPCRRLTGL